MDFPSAELCRNLRRALLNWFHRLRRDLPWRRDRDPYRIWVSEIMLQQTQVATVIPYFERFLQAFPTVADLAAAPEADVLRIWEGLGYYRRARDLHRAAQQVMTEHGGQVPEDPEVMARLPGIGRYTLGAILSQAFDQRLPILEANSLRVLCRLFGQRGDPHRGPVRRWLWQVAEVLLPKRQVGEFNQALMELGALVCTPSNPRCRECPVAKWCEARRLGLQEEIPERKRPPEIVLVQEVAVVIRRGAQVLIVQRPPEGRWAGMWEFPHAVIQGKETHEAVAVRLLQERTSIRAKLGPELSTLRHSVTRHRITLVCFLASYQGGRFRSSFYQAGQWVRPEQLSAYPFSVPQRKLAQMLICPTRQPRLF